MQNKCGAFGRIHELYMCRYSPLDEKVFSVHSLYAVDCKLVLICCEILRGSEVSEMLLGFMSLRLTLPEIGEWIVRMK